MPLTEFAPFTITSLRHEGLPAHWIPPQSKLPTDPEHKKKKKEKGQRNRTNPSVPPEGWCVLVTRRWRRRP